MSIIATAILAFSMSTDAFAVSLGHGARSRVGKGASLSKPKLGEAFRTGAIFGAVEGVTPVIGWGLGLVAGAYVQAVDHWIAFTLLAGIGLRMIYAALKNEIVAEQKPARHGLLALVITALGTSINSMAVGVSLSVLSAPVAVTATAIGLATFTMVTIGLMTGQYLGEKFGKTAEICGGIALVFLGTKILLEHLGYI